ncbi:MAG: gliding motility-associated C-terminal domain-containing protein, partial [Bacteroidota bacterium]
PPVRATFVGSGSGLKGIAKWEWDFGDGVTTTTLTDSVVHAYNQAGTYQVTLTATDSLGCSVTVTQDERIEVLADVIPEPVAIHALSVLSDNQLEIKFSPHKGDDFRSYTIYREEDGVGFVPVHTTNYIADTIWVDETVEANLQAYCYKVTATNYCGTESNLGLTESHCSVELTATPVPGEIRLNWTPYRGWESVDHYEVYEVENYGQRGRSFLAVVPGNQTSYAVPFADCFNQVDYRVRAIGTRSIQVSWSDTTRAANEIGEIGDPMEIIRATVVDNQSVLVEWEPADLPGIAFIKLQRSINGAPYTNYATLPPGELRFSDPQVSVTQNSYAYRVISEDSCGNTTPLSNIGKTILLSTEQNLVSAILNWTPYQEWQTGVNRYRIEVFNDTLGTWTEADYVDGSSLSFKDEATNLNQPRLCYRVVALEEVGNDAISYSNEGCIRVETSLVGANAFTPNGDDVNDYFFLTGIHIQTFNMQIFSRWGLKVFETNNPDDKWDGTYKGAPVKEGVYVYVARGLGYNGEPYVLRGTISLYR